MKVENKTVKNYPTEQMVKRQEWLKYLDSQRKLKEYVRQTYSKEIVEERGLIYLIYNNWDTFGKQLFLDYTGVLLDRDRQKVTQILDIRKMPLVKYRFILWKCSHCGFEWVTSTKARLDNGCRCKNCHHKITSYDVNKDYFDVPPIIKFSIKISLQNKIFQIKYE